jgi:hypothetical protein
MTSPILLIALVGRVLVNFARPALFRQITGPRVQEGRIAPRVGIGACSLRASIRWRDLWHFAAHSSLRATVARLEPLSERLTRVAAFTFGRTGVSLFLPIEKAEPA